MKNIVFAIVSLIILSSCEKDKTNYNEGYKNGFDQGQVQGFEKGKEDGFKAGYDKGYNDGAKLNYKDITLTDSKESIFIKSNFYLFTYTSIVIFIIILTIIIITSFANNLPNTNYFFHRKNKNAVIGKSIFIFVGFITAYLIMQMIDISNLVFFDIKNNTLKWIIVTITLPTAFILGLLIDKALKAEKIGLDVVLIVFSTFIIFYFFLFLTNVEMYILRKGFVSYWLVSITLGGLIYAGYKLITTRIHEGASEKKST